MACNWRIRHKLMLGMALVLGLMALLLGGTLKGLSSYRRTMITFDGKLIELREAEQLKEKIRMLHTPIPSIARQNSTLLERAIEARKTLDQYREKLRETMHLRTDRDEGLEEYQQLEALENGFTRLLAALEKAREPSVNGNNDLQAESHPVRAAIDGLITTANDLIGIINDKMRTRIDASRGEYRNSLTILISTSILAVLCMAGLLNHFYRWVVGPIRQLELGAGRISRGDFELRLDIRTGDEMQDLSQAFNTMTDRLSEMYTNLATQVNERSRQLVRSERLAGVGFLAAGVAHEINNPLASIAFCSEAIEGRLGDLFEQSKAESAERDTIKKYLKMIGEEAFRCKEITQRLLAFSRGGERKREETDLSQIIQGVLDVVQHLQNSKGKMLEFQTSGPIPAWVNGQEIKQVFLNLVVNALDSMDEGGKLSITHETKGNQVELIFQDSGCGMTEEVLENIFEPFFTRSRTGKGTGLGLSISHRIISQHGGEISAESKGPGQGSIFHIRLPIEPPLEEQQGTEDVLDPEEEFLKLSNAKQQRRAA